MEKSIEYLINQDFFENIFFLLILNCVLDNASWIK